MDADGVTFACATTAEQRAARRAGARTALVGLAAANGVPEGPVVSFGLAGALRDDLATGTVLDATRVVDASGAVLWEGEPLGVPGASPGTILAADEVVDAPAERRRLHERTGADAADLESGPLARSGRLRGVVRAVSDTPDRTLHGICAAVKPGGPYDWPGLVRAFVREPRGFAQAAADAKRALDHLAAATKSWASR
jgi:nucleoside phosphorylase